jgi:hypothetical protein
MTEWTDWPIDVDQAEEDYRSNVESCLPIGWKVHDDDVVRWIDCDEPANLTRIREAIAKMTEAFDVADYAIDPLDRI